MGNANDGTTWSGTEESEQLDLKDPQGPNDPNVGTRWGEPQKPGDKPPARVRREIDEVLEREGWKCPHCGLQIRSESSRKQHQKVGDDGLTVCQRERANFKETAPAIDEDRLAAKVASAVGVEVANALAAVLGPIMAGKAVEPKKKRGRPPKKDKERSKASGSAASIPGRSEAGGPKSIPSVEPEDQSVADSTQEPQNAE